NPVNTFVARAVGSPPMNLISGTLAGGEAVASEGYRLPLGNVHGIATDGRPLTFGIRPEDIFFDTMVFHVVDPCFAGRAAVEKNVLG
ncbi:hypothetical protein ACC735_38915, partial [Rhizobium ruizarguesonis]